MDHPFLISTEWMTIPLLLSTVPAGFPSPASDHLDVQLNLHDHLVLRPASTFFVRASGGSMRPHIHPGDLLVVDRSIAPRHGQVVVVMVDGEVAVRRLVLRQAYRRFVADAEGYPPLSPTNSAEAEVWGVVTHSIHTLYHGR